MIETLQDVKEFIQATLDGNEESLAAFGKTYLTQLKCYLVESTGQDVRRIGCPIGTWHSLDAPGWYANEEDKRSSGLFLDASQGRVWRLYSLLDAVESDGLVDKWIRSTRGLDYAWLSRYHMFRWEQSGTWKLRGIGLRFSDGLTPIDEQGHFSLKAWHGAAQYLRGLQELLDVARDNFAIHSARWQKIADGSVSVSSEWYSNGKVTVNRGVDVDEVLAHISDMAFQYQDALSFASELREDELGAFEFNFAQKVDLDAFSNVVARGIGDMRLWMLEVESEPDFRRFKGLDLHTWDRVFLDLGEDFAYLTIPAKGCINAIPRLAVIQGEDNGGKTDIFYNGERVFA